MKDVKGRIRLAGAAVFFVGMAGMLGVVGTPSDLQACDYCVEESTECGSGPNQLCKETQTCVGWGETKKCTTEYYYYH